LALRGRLTQDRYQLGMTCFVRLLLRCLCNVVLGGLGICVLCDVCGLGPPVSAWAS
jgi:hypothetical protein